MPPARGSRQRPVRRKDLGISRSIQTAQKVDGIAVTQPPDVRQDDRGMNPVFVEKQQENP